MTTGLLKQWSTRAATGTIKSETAKIASGLTDPFFLLCLKEVTAEMFAVVTRNPINLLTKPTH